MLTWLNPKTWMALIGVLAIGIAIGAIGHWRYASNKAAKVELAQVKETVKKDSEVVTALEVKKDERKQTYRKINAAADRVAADHSNICVDDRGLSVINAALGGVALKLDFAMSKAGTNDRKNGG